MPSAAVHRETRQVAAQVAGQRWIRRIESCIKVVKCDGMDGSVDGWRMPDESWLDMERADDGVVLVVNVMRAECKEPPECFKDDEEFLV
jgi:hypothetical protein